MTGLLTSQLQVRRDLAADWVTANPVLASGEIGQESDTLFHKIGDGVTAWNSLIYYHGPPWLQGADGGAPSTTYGVGPNGSYHGVMSSAPGPITENSTKDDPDWANVQIYGVGYDGDDTMIVSLYHYPSFERRVYVCGADLVDPVSFDMNDITGWTSGIFQQFSHIQWSPKLSRWVGYTGRGQGFYCDGDPSVGANWIEITYPTNRPSMGAFINVRNMIWSYTFEMFITMQDGHLAESLEISIDGITWYRWADYEALGGSLPNRMDRFTEHYINSAQRNLIWQQESYNQKDGSAGAGILGGGNSAPENWTYSGLNGIIRNTSNVTLNAAASDGNVLTVVTLNELNCTEFSLSHPDRWGPDGNSNQGWLDPDMGWAAFGYQKTIIMYLPQFARPWKIFREDNTTTPENTNHGWWDAASIDYAPTRTSGNAPQFQLCTDEPFASLNTEYFADYLHRPASIQIGFGSAWIIYDTGHPTIANHVLGENGWFVVMRTDISRENDYLIFRKPG